MEIAGVLSTDPDAGYPSRKDAMLLPPLPVTAFGPEVKDELKLKEGSGELGCNSPMGIKRKSAPNFNWCLGSILVKAPCQLCVLSLRAIKSDEFGAIPLKPEGAIAGSACTGSCWFRVAGRPSEV